MDGPKQELCGEECVGSSGKEVGTPNGRKWTAQRGRGVGGVVEHGGIGYQVSTPDGPKWTARSVYNIHFRRP